jgi:hypothetical protein
MVKLFKITTKLLREQKDILSTLRQSITERKPITIDYSGPIDEVLPGKRIDIEPIILGKNTKSGNLVIWAYVFNGVSKKGLPNWKMFRVDRIQNVNFNPNIEPFSLNDLPGYEKGKAPNAMKSLSSVDVYSPYWYDDQQKQSTEIQPQPEQQPIPEPQSQEAPPIEEPTPEAPPQPVEEPDMDAQNQSQDVFNMLGNKITDVNGRKSISTQDYNNALNDLYHRKEGEWKDYQRNIGANFRPDEGTRARFNRTSKQELDDLLSKNNIEISDSTIPNNLSEMFRRFKVLINL